MKFEKIGTVDDFLPGMPFVHKFEYDTVLVYKTADNQFYAIEDICSHDGGPLGEGPMIDCQVSCPRHGATFDVRTGAATSAPAFTAIRTFAVKVEGNDVFLEAPEEEDW